MKLDWREAFWIKWTADAVKIIFGAQPKNPDTWEPWQKKLNKYVKHVESAKRVWGEHVAYWAGAAIQEVALKYRKPFVSNLTRSGEATWQPLAMKSLRAAMVSDVNTALDNGAEDVRKYYRQNYRRIIETRQTQVSDEAISKAIERGMRKDREGGGGTPKSVRDEILKTLERNLANGQVVVVSRNGRLIHYEPKYYAEMVARTRLAEAQSNAALNTCKEFNKDLIKVNSHTGNISPKDVLCYELQGKVFSISGTHPKYPKLEHIPPFHPNCGHRLLPYIEDL